MKNLKFVALNPVPGEAVTIQFIMPWFRSKSIFYATVYFICQGIVYHEEFPVTTLPSIQVGYVFNDGKFEGYSAEESRDILVSDLIAQKPVTIKDENPPYDERVVPYIENQKLQRYEDAKTHTVYLIPPMAAAHPFALEDSHIAKQAPVGLDSALFVETGTVENNHCILNIKARFAYRMSANLVEAIACCMKYPSVEEYYQQLAADMVNAKFPCPLRSKMRLRFYGYSYNDEKSFLVTRVEILNPINQQLSIQYGPPRKKYKKKKDLFGTKAKHQNNDEMSIQEKYKDDGRGTTYKKHLSAPSSKKYKLAIKREKEPSNNEQKNYHAADTQGSVPLSTESGRGGTAEAAEFERTQEESLFKDIPGNTKFVAAAIHCGRLMNTKCRFETVPATLSPGEAPACVIASLGCALIFEFSDEKLTLLTKTSPVIAEKIKQGIVSIMNEHGHWSNNYAKELPFGKYPVATIRHSLKRTNEKWGTIMYDKLATMHPIS